jgi:abortive infection bacteriophage resistance protein
MDPVRIFTPDERIDDLRQRGLIIGDLQIARNAIEAIGQHRLKQYWTALFDKSVIIDGHHFFSPGATFEEVLDLYYMDRELRGLLILPLELIEINLRSSVATVFENRGLAFSLYEDDFLRPVTPTTKGLGKPTNLLPWQPIHKKVLKQRESYKFLKSFENHAYPELARLDEQEQLHFLENKVKYPISLIVETISFSDLSKLLENIQQSELKSEILKRFESWDKGALIPFIKRITNLRNAVAHHGRVWNKPLVWPGPMPKFYRDSIPANTNLSGYQGTSIFEVLSLLLDLTPKLLQGQTGWNDQVLDFVYSQDRKTLQRMGFPGNWHEYRYWQR